MLKPLTVILFVLVTLNLKAQDSHYWNIPYGAYSTLLGGAVIGSAYDLSASYYNPGMLSIHTEPGLEIGTQLYNLTKLKLDFERDRNKDLTKNSITPLPGFIAGRIGHDSTATNRFTYSYFGKLLYSTVLEHRFNYDDNSENRFYELYLNQDLRENWAGFTYSQKISRNLGFGVTAYGIYRTQDLRHEFTNSGVKNGGLAKSVEEKSQTYYYNISFLFKAGIAYTKGPLTAGITITTPNFKIMGSGEIYRFREINNADSLNTFATTYQEGIKSYFNSPLAAGFGFGYDFKKFKLHASLEWINSVKAYELLEAAPYLEQTSQKTIVPNTTQSTNSIINFGIGLELLPSSTHQLYLSYYKDNSIIGGSGKSPFLITSWDLHHISAGSIFKLFDSRASVGLAYAWGSKVVDESKIKKGSISAEDFLTESNSFITYRQVSVLFGITLTGKR